MKELHSLIWAWDQWVEGKGAWRGGGCWVVVRYGSGCGWGEGEGGRGKEALRARHKGEGWALHMNT